MTSVVGCRAEPVEFAIEQLSNDVLKSIFDAAFLEAEIDEDGDLFVKDTCKVWVHGMPDRDCFEFKCFIGIGDGFSRQQVLEACNRFNGAYLGLKVSAVPDNDGLGFAYQVLMKGGGKIEGKEIIRLFRYFQEVVRDSLSDEDVFDFLQ